MATQAQMDADPYYRAETVTPALDWLGDELCRATGRPRDAAGTKGDRFHLNGAHRSQRFIRFSPLCTNRTYTVDPVITGEQLDWISGFDFTPGSVDQMIIQTKRLIAAMKAGWLDEVDACYGNVDGDKIVDGWDNVADRAATSDSSHLWHWHATIKRRFAGSMILMKKIFAIVMGTYNPNTQEGTDMDWFALPYKSSDPNRPTDEPTVPAGSVWQGNTRERWIVKETVRGTYEQKPSITPTFQGPGTLEKLGVGVVKFRGDATGWVLTADSPIGMGPVRKDTAAFNYDELAKAIIANLPEGLVVPTAEQNGDAAIDELLSRLQNGTR